MYAAPYRKIHHSDHVTLLNVTVTLWWVVLYGGCIHVTVMLTLILLYVHSIAMGAIIICTYTCIRLCITWTSVWTLLTIPRTGWSVGCYGCSEDCKS